MWMMHRKEAADETTFEKACNKRSTAAKCSHSADVDEISTYIDIYIKRYNAPRNGSEEASSVLAATVIPL